MDCDANIELIARDDKEQKRDGLEEVTAWSTFPVSEDKGKGRFFLSKSTFLHVFMTFLFAFYFIYSNRILQYMNT